MRKKIWKVIHTIFQIRVFENLLRLFVKGKFSDAFIIRFVPPFFTYKNPTYRIAPKQNLKLLANLYDYNDWKAYWGILEYEREKLYKLAEHARNVVDIGANNGWVLLNIANIISKNKGFIYGFEPFPETYNRCVENIKRSNVKNATVFNKGCGESEGSFKMSVVTETNSGQNRIVENSLVNNHHTVEVLVTTLDNQLKDVENIDLIKIDVEGFELHVLKGAERIISKNKPFIFIEINDPLLRSNETSPWEVLNLLKNNYGYILKSASDDTLITEDRNFDGIQLDVICYPS